MKNNGNPKISLSYLECISLILTLTQILFIKNIGMRLIIILLRTYRLNRQFPFCRGVDQIEKLTFGCNMESGFLEFRCVGIESGGKIPIENTGRGQDISPEFVIENLSPKAKTLAVTLEDLSHPIKNFTLDYLEYSGCGQS